MPHLQVWPSSFKGQSQSRSHITVAVTHHSRGLVFPSKGSSLAIKFQGAVTVAVWSLLQKENFIISLPSNYFLLNYVLF